MFDRIGLFDTKYRLAADREWMLRAFIAGVAVTELERPVYRYRSHAGSSTMDRARRNYAAIRREHLDIAARYLREPEITDSALRRALRRWHAAEVGMLGWHYAKRGELAGLPSILADASRLASLWPLTLAGETVRHVARRWSK